MNLLSLLFVSMLTWNDLEFDQRYTLTESLPISSSITLPVGTQIQHLDQIPLDELRVQIFDFQIENCTAQMAQANTDIVIYQDVYGLNMKPECILEVYVENRDLPRTAFLKLLDRK